MTLLSKRGVTGVACKTTTETHPCPIPPVHPFYTGRRFGLVNTSAAGLLNLRQ